MPYLRYHPEVHDSVHVPLRYSNKREHFNLCHIILNLVTLHCSPTNDQEELFDQIAEGRYEFTSPYWDEVSESATVSADVSTVTPFIFFLQQNIVILLG